MQYIRGVVYSRMRSSDKAEWLSLQVLRLGATDGTGRRRTVDVFTLSSGTDFATFSSNMPDEESRSGQVPCRVPKPVLHKIVVGTYNEVHTPCLGICMYHVGTYEVLRLCSARETRRNGSERKEGHRRIWDKSHL